MGLQFFQLIKVAPKTEFLNLRAIYMGFLIELACLSYGNLIMNVSQKIIIRSLSYLFCNWCPDKCSLRTSLIDHIYLGRINRCLAFSCAYFAFFSISYHSLWLLFKSCKCNLKHNVNLVHMRIPGGVGLGRSLLWCKHLDTKRKQSGAEVYIFFWWFTAIVWEKIKLP